MPTATRKKMDNDYEAFRQSHRDRGIPLEDMIQRRDNFITSQNSFRLQQGGVRYGRGTPVSMSTGKRSWRTFWQRTGITSWERMNFMRSRSPAS